MAPPSIRAERRRALRESAGRVLEVGFGCGGTLTEYPSEAGRIASLVGLEPNPGMTRRAATRISSAPFPVRIVRASASALPFPDETFDTVTTNWTLCSLRDLEPSLHEIRRVLGAGGRFLFLEHGRAHDPKLRRRQELIAPLFRLLGGGCHLGRPIDEALRAAGFRIETLERYEGTLGPRTARQMYRGTARRA